MPSNDHSHHRSSSGKTATKVVKVYEWQCHVCGLGGMEAVTQPNCANCVHVRCPECHVKVTPLPA